MGKAPKKRFSDSDDLKDLERLVRSAGTYVVATEDLRPRVIEAARDRILNRRINRCFLGGFASCLVLWCLFMPFREEFGRWRVEWMAPSAKEMEQIADSLDTKAEFGPNWALAEAFMQVRASRAKTISSMLLPR